jgi:PilZ domain
MTYSRRVKRLRAGWDGCCTIENEPGERRCRIDDISMLGLGVTLTHPSPSQLAGRRISVDVPAMARLEGEITHAEVILGGAVRVGIVFNDHSAATTDVTTSQSTMGDSSGR